MKSILDFITIFKDIKTYKGPGPRTMVNGGTILTGAWEYDSFTALYSLKFIRESVSLTTNISTEESLKGKNLQNIPGILLPVISTNSAPRFFNVSCNKE